MFKSLIAALSAALACAAATAHAATPYPSKPIRFVVPFAPAGTTDILARIVANGMTEALGHQVIVDNRAGAGGLVGAETVAKSTPDGHTILMGTSSINAINPALYRKLPYNHLIDFTSISLVGMVPNVLVVNTTLPAKSVSELIAYAKTQPGKLSYASPGAGTAMHLAGEWFKDVANLDIVHVPYKGSGPALTDVASGQVQIMFNTIPATLGFVKSGRLRALAVTSRERSRALPDTPTAIEAGLRDFEVTSWFGVFARSGTPKPIIERLNGTIVKIVRAPDTSEKLVQIGVDPAANTPEQFAAFVKSETDKWARVVRKIGLTLD